MAGNAHKLFPEIQAPVAPEAFLDSFLGPPGLYLHIPFCRSLCPFCPYNKVRHDAALAARYLRSLEIEADLYLAAFDGSFTSLYVGGGTPTLCLEPLAPLLERLPVHGERAIELMPGRDTEATVEDLVRLGFTHVSVGVQSFDEGVLRHLGRPNTVADNERTLEQVAGRFACVDVDLIFDVAFEDEQTFLDDVRTCFEAGADQVSTYPLMRFGYTPFGKATHNRAVEHERLAQAAAIGEDHGYRRTTVWTFLKEASVPYSSITRPFYLGLGAGAASYTGRRFTVNHFAIEPYVQRLAAAQPPIAREALMGRRMAAAYYLFWQAYTGSIDLGRYRELFPHALPAGAATSLLKLFGLVRGKGNVCSLTKRGFDRYHDFERWVTYRYIEPLWELMMREHAAPAQP